jgi:Arc/MetJ family transcription regulator
MHVMLEQLLGVDAELLARAVEDGGHPSPREAMNAALKQYVEGIDRRKRFEAIAGTIDYRDGYPRRDKSPPKFYADDDEDPR